ncbi:hypothetical protein CGLO_12882 [Colletotrichum gloeosporioides Cg-14]|uniref:Uncharacterized protein n=1 Tax=Colletotrichum gloeosporioides (strain Cg-14) TaxID=1237896 RepID=T0K4R4_COLGC|nr:hypothetical protein CGLO_12882 [Colletotrichum gloeosporioides Cg-14]
MATKTYILAPNFTYKPGGPIQLGSIIADPFRPAKALSKPTTPPAYETVFHHNLEASCETGRSVKLSLWASIFDTAGARISASRARNAVNSLSVDRLETRYLTQELADDDPDLVRRLKEPRVQAAIKSGLFGRAPVYLISGIKIARGLTVRTERGRGVGGSLTGTAPTAQAIGIDLGASIEGEEARSISSSFEAGDEDIIIAYQLHIIKARGKSTGLVTADVFQSDATFLHDDASDEMEDDIEISTGGVEELAEAAREMEIELETERIFGLDGKGLTCVQAREG